MLDKIIRKYGFENWRTVWAFRIAVLFGKGV